VYNWLQMHFGDLPYWHEIIPHPKISNLFLLPRTTRYMSVLRCINYVFDVCNTKFTVYYGQILVWSGINYIPQGTIELILRDDFGPVRYAHMYAWSLPEFYLGVHMYASTSS